MRNSTKRPSRRRLSRFERGGGSGTNRDVIRFRRNRESLVREWTVLLLWAAVVFLLVRLTGSLHAVGTRHLADQPTLVRWSLPAAAMAAILFALWRSRGTWREILDLRREQAKLGKRMRATQAHDPDAS